MTVGIQLVKCSEHGLGLYYRPKEGRDSDCDVPVWIKEAWQWILERALGLPSQKPAWLSLPVMRRIAISTPNVMAALRRLNRDKARPYNFALSPVLVNLSDAPITLLGPFEKNSALWEKMQYVNIHDGKTHTLNPPTLLALPQTFEMVLSQYQRHPEYKSLAPDGTPCSADTAGLLRRYPVTVSGLHLIGKETERGWEQAEDISTLLPSLVRYGEKGIARGELSQRLKKIPLAVLERETGLSRHTIVRGREGRRVQARSLQLLRIAVRTIPSSKCQSIIHWTGYIATRHMPGIDCCPRVLLTAGRWADEKSFRLRLSISGSIRTASGLAILSGDRRCRTPSFLPEDVLRRSGEG